MNLKKVLSLASVLSAFGVVAIASPAHASVVCNVTDVAWFYDSSNTGELQVYCGGVWYYADIANGACTGVGANNVRAYLTLAQAAFLAGKSANVQFTVSGATNCLSYFQLN